MKVDKVFFDFGDAFKYAKQGIKVTRKGWNEAKYVIYRPGYPEGIPADKKTAEECSIEEGTIIKVNPYFQIKTVFGTYSAWTPTADDILAEDWYALVLD